MKIWYQYGSEHSSNLVMIGHFQNVAEAVKAKEIIDELTTHAREEELSGTRTDDHPSDRYDQTAINLLRRLELYAIGPSELDQFAYEFDIRTDERTLVLTTEEIEISAFLKVMFLKGARVEVYSAHDYPDSPHGRGR